MKVDVFLDMLKKVNYEITLAKKGCKVIMLMDSFSGHAVSEKVILK